MLCPHPKLTKINNSLGVILPKELLAKFKLEKGDELFILNEKVFTDRIGHHASF